MNNKKANLRYVLILAVFVLVVASVVADLTFNTNDLAPPDNTYTQNPKPSFTVNVSSNNFTNVINCTLLINGTLSNFTNATNNTLAVLTANTTLTEGLHTWAINCSDNNNTNLTTNRTIIADRTAPTVTLVNSSFNTTSTTPSITFSFTDAFSPTANCTLFFNSLPQSNNASVLVGTNTVLQSTALSDGSYAINVSCIDLAGNVGNSSPITVKVDNGKPYVGDLATQYQGPLGYGIINNADLFFSTATGNNLVNLSINLTDATTAVKNVTFDFSNVCSSGNTTTTSSVGGLWYGTCTVDVATAINTFTPVNISMTACDLLHNCNSSLYRTVILYNMTTPPMPPGCLRFGSQTTDLSTVTNFSSVNFTIQMEFNGSCLTGPGGGSSPWTGYQQIMMMNFTSLDMSSQTIGLRLAGLKDALVVNISPPHVWGPTKIYLNSSAFAELNANVTITLNNLPFTNLPNITCAENSSKTETNLAFTPDTPFVFSILHYKGDGPANISVPRGNLTFTVSGFSTYDVNDTVNPWITLVSPSTFTSSNSSVLVNVIVNGTGSDLSLIQITNLSGGPNYVYNATGGDISDSANCVNLTAGSDLLNCTVLMDNVAEGSHTLTITANDFAYPQPGNTNSTSQTIIIDQTAPTVTMNSPDGGSFTNSTSVTVNFTANDNADSAINCTLTRTPANVTNLTVSNTSTTYTYTSLTNGTYNWSVNCTDDAGFSTVSSTRNFTVDRTVPVVHLIAPASGGASNSTTPVHYFNVTDSWSTSFDCTVNWTGNVSETQNFTETENFTADNATSTSAGYLIGVSNGVVNWSVSCTDQGGNNNITRSWFNVSDTTAPVMSGASPSGVLASASSETLSITTDEYAYCSYSNSSTDNYTSMTLNLTPTYQNRTTHTASVSVGSGAYDYYVLCSDVNSNDDTTATHISFTVAGSGGGGGTGGGGGGGIGTATPTNPQASQTWDLISPGVNKIMKVTSDDFGIKEIELGVNTAANNVNLVVEKLPAKLSTMPDLSGKVFKYLQITAKNLASTNLKGVAKIRFQVTQSWLSTNGVSSANIVLDRLVNGAWQQLKTTLLKSDSTNAYYEAETPGFSYFAITVSAPAATPTTPAPATTPAETTVTHPTEQPAATTPAPTETTTTQPSAPAKTTGTAKTGASPLVTILTIVIIVLAIVLIILAIARKKKPKHRSLEE